MSTFLKRRKKECFVCLFLFVLFCFALESEKESQGNTEHIQILQIQQK